MFSLSNFKGKQKLSIEIQLSWLQMPENLAATKRDFAPNNLLSVSADSHVIYR